MPEESIAAYINNIIAFTLFIAVVTLIFAALFLLSRILIYRSRKKYRMTPERKLSSGRPLFLFNYKKDPYQSKNIFILALAFSYVISFILLILIVFDYAVDPTPGLNMYLITAIVLYFILTAIYVVKSKIIN
jgi:uncharacterized membrane protein YqjE